MSLTIFLLVFVVVWWVVIFAILPIGVKSVGESGEPQAHGVEEGAPVRPQLLKKIVLTTVISAVLSVAITLVWPSIDQWLTKEAGMEDDGS
jgi:predicted secreted protein